MDVLVFPNGFVVPYASAFRHDKVISFNTPNIACRTAGLSSLVCFLVKADHGWRKAMCNGEYTVLAFTLRGASLGADRSLSQQ